MTISCTRMRAKASFCVQERQLQCFEGLKMLLVLLEGQYVIVPVTICQIPFITSIWLAPQCTKNGRHCPSPLFGQGCHGHGHDHIIHVISSNLKCLSRSVMSAAYMYKRRAKKRKVMVEDTTSWLTWKKDGLTSS